ncbi:MAG: hypothetical protein QY325_08100 [Flavobacteriales bacterium]|jgi:uncharacterized repeat protein (TIGR01451 family)|nr:MAG: hypothetical protein QY325_08100 [Flavobacteriales bacterium]
MRSLLTLFLVLAAIASSAITVSIQVTEQPICAYSNGILTASASGGVGPYTYLWSTGATSVTINGLTAGTYSVTVTDANLDEATDEVTVTATDFGPSFSAMNWSGDAWCSGFLVPQPFFRWAPSWPMTPPYTFNGVPPLDDPLSMDGWHYVGIPGAPGQIVTMNFMDGTGCAATFQIEALHEVEWPIVTVMQVEGACAGGANGSVQVAFGPEGHGYPVSAEIRNMQDQVVLQGGYDWYGSAVFYKTYTGLGPGTYRLIQRLTMSSPSQFYSGCSDETLFTIPDLGPTCGTVSGQVFVDGNYNCTKQTNEAAVPSAILEVQPGPYYITANAQGSYATNLPIGAYTIAQVSAQFEEHCAGVPQPFTISGSPGSVTVNFPDSSLVPLDVSVEMASGAARPGFQLQYGINVRNHTPTNSGATQVVMTFDPALGYLSANPAPSNVNGNVITWNQSQLTAWQQRHYSVRLQVPPDIGLLGTVFNGSATVSTANADAAPANNSSNHAVTVTGSYDPNDKLARTSSQYSDAIYYIGTDEWIDYTIRFQNTGTDTAFNVVITDTLPPTLDPASLVIGAGSHPFTWEVRDDGVLKFYFINILLPDSNVNEPASNGFVGFRIRPRLPLTPGTLIENIANIYFDFNPPVITEPSVLVAEFSTGVGEESTPRMTIQPNPAMDRLYVLTQAPTSGSYSVLAADGREVRPPGNWHGHRLELDVSLLTPGLYMLQLDGYVERFIKQ